MLVRLEDGRQKDVAITEVTPDNYIVPAGEEIFWHCVIEVRKFSPSTGQRLSVPRIQKFDDKMWKGIMERNLKLRGYSVTILHDPTIFIAEAKERDARLKESLRTKSKEQREKEFQDAVQKAVAAELAKLQNNSKGKRNADTGNSKG